VLLDFVLFSFVLLLQGEEDNEEEEEEEGDEEEEDEEAHKQEEWIMNIKKRAYEEGWSAGYHHGVQEPKGKRSLKHVRFALRLWLLIACCCFSALFSFVIICWFLACGSQRESAGHSVFN